MIKTEGQNQIYGTQWWELENDIEEMLRRGLASPNACVIFVGSAGARLAGATYRAGLPNTTVVAIDVSSSSIKRAEADKKLLIGHPVTRGKDTNGFPEVGQRCADLAKEEIEEAMYGSDVVYVVIPMGGGTATGVGPEIVKMAREDGRIVFSIVIKPFSFEDRDQTAMEKAMVEIEENSNATVYIDNDEFLSTPEMTFQRFENTLARLVTDTIRSTTQLMEAEIARETFEYAIPYILEDIERQMQINAGAPMASPDLMSLGDENNDGDQREDPGKQSEKGADEVLDITFLIEE